MRLTITGRNTTHVHTHTPHAHIHLPHKDYPAMSRHLNAGVLTMHMCRGSFPRGFVGAASALAPSSWGDNHFRAELSIACGQVEVCERAVRGITLHLVA
jgi:hypothetical protein